MSVQVQATALFRAGFAEGEITDLPLQVVNDKVRLKFLLWDTEDCIDMVNWEIDQFILGFQQGRRLRDTTPQEPADIQAGLHALAQKGVDI